MDTPTVLTYEEALLAIHARIGTWQTVEVHAHGAHLVEIGGLLFAAEDATNGKADDTETIVIGLLPGAMSVILHRALFADAQECGDELALSHGESAFVFRPMPDDESEEFVRLYDLA